MQTPKTRTGSLEVPKRISPVTPPTARKLKTPGSDSDSIPSPNPASRTPKDRSPKVVERRSPRSPVSEKKRPSKVSELESRLAQLQEELKKAKDELSSSESWKKLVQQEAEETKKQLAAMSEKLEESQQQLAEHSDSEQARIQELRMISQERDRAWQSELEAVQKHHAMDSVALSSATNEIQKLNAQLERVAESEAAQARHAELAHIEIQNLRMELTKTLSLVEKLKIDLSDSKQSEARALEISSKTQMQLEMAKTAEDVLRSESLKAMEAYKSLTTELEKSKAQANLLEELVRKLQADLSKICNKSSVNPSCVQENGEHEDSSQLTAELNQVKFEVDQLRSALAVAEKRHEEECIQSKTKIRSAYELLERTKSELCLREAELESKLKAAKAEIEDLKANLMAKEVKLQSISEDNEVLNQKIKENQLTEGESTLEMEMKRFEAELADLKSSLLDKESKVQSVTEENERLKLEIKNRETESEKVNGEALALVEAARAAEREALMKLGYLTEEADKSSRKAARVTEQLDAAQAANSEMEAELRRLKVQSDQWRKAAEAAAAMLSGGNNGKYVERTGSLDSNYNTIGGKLGSPFSEDMDDESPKKKNSSMFKKLGVLLKKGSK
ncbi:interactor of constitutive active ROPs 2, chloroplastic [Diospyros lotus]|uniref:interactor of constitutive active ROPs 2, chloroplastic n=1 Tax=Diospyros lotus TaxID=55363 RepID=UPI00225679A6|nr:interactor of constitutive active ROPs 2, chloroplastic [Diospyros lotus]XP_052173493.1 interactor of constitutive active ROPs 2, chloroplastic [Diospyros lotus]XP_052173494.1 interactor of constitutive active ROPs 2, chloroplastic [Diospyros lotus]XP_052173495.1 interactor of constitutive active ROPs 2, chloroplastic [Diospyros lotus]